MTKFEGQVSSKDLSCCENWTQISPINYLLRMFNHQLIVHIIGIKDQFLLLTSSWATTPHHQWKKIQLHALKPISQPLKWFLPFIYSIYFHIWTLFIRIFITLNLAYIMLIQFFFLFNWFHSENFMSLYSIFATNTEKNI